MQYCKDAFHNIFIRLNDDGSTLMIKIEWDRYLTKKRVTKVYMDEGFNKDWDLLYLDYSHSNKREFDEAERNARI